MAVLSTLENKPKSTTHAGMPQRRMRLGTLPGHTNQREQRVLAELAPAQSNRETTCPVAATWRGPTTVALAAVAVRFAKYCGWHCCGGVAEPVLGVRRTRLLNLRGVEARRTRRLRAGREGSHALLPADAEAHSLTAPAGARPARGPHPSPTLGCAAEPRPPCEGPLRWCWMAEVAAASLAVA